MKCNSGLSWSSRFFGVWRCFESVNELDHVFFFCLFNDAFCNSISWAAPNVKVTEILNWKSPIDCLTLQSKTNIELNWLSRLTGQTTTEKWFDSHQDEEIFSIMLRGATQPTVRCKLGALSALVNTPGCDFTTYFNQLVRLRTRENTPISL